MTAKMRPQVGLLVIVFFIVCIGLFSVATSSYDQAKVENRGIYHYLLLHCVWLVLGTMIFLGIALLKVRMLEKLSVFTLIITLVLSALVVFTPLGVTVNGATRWLALGPIQIQPSEFLKLGLNLGLSWWVTRRAGHPRNIWPGFLVATVVLLAAAGVVIKQDDLGTCLIILLIGFVVLLAARVRVNYIASLGAVLLIAAVLFVATKPYRMDRVHAWLDPWKHKSDQSYQVVQSFYAFGLGSWHGSGLGQGTAKYYIPHAHTDFVFATIAEETGLIGGGTVLALFTALGCLGVVIAGNARKPFARLVALGCTAYICGQAALNIAVVTGVVPCTGIPLPFISYGGSSMLSSAMAIGLLLSVSRNTGGRGTEDIDEDHGNRRRNRRPRISGTGSSGGTPRTPPRTPTAVRR